eukprot:1195761-Prorocentrum_minimum.AAC.9
MVIIVWGSARQTETFSPSTTVEGSSDWHVFQWAGMCVVGVSSVLSSSLTLSGWSGASCSRSFRRSSYSVGSSCVLVSLSSLVSLPPVPPSPQLPSRAVPGDHGHRPPLRWLLSYLGPSLYLFVCSFPCVLVSFPLRLLFLSLSFPVLLSTFPEFLRPLPSVPLWDPHRGGPLLFVHRVGLLCLRRRGRLLGGREVCRQFVCELGGLGQHASLVVSSRFLRYLTGLPLLGGCSLCLAWSRALRGGASLPWFVVLVYTAGGPPVHRPFGWSYYWCFLGSLCVDYSVSTLFSPLCRSLASSDFCSPSLFFGWLAPRQHPG